MINEKQGKKWIELKKPLGSCSHCVHNLECEPLQNHVLDSTLNGKYRFQCPILVEVDEDIEYGCD